MTDCTVPTYLIDLERPEQQRWAEVIAAERDAARCLMEEAAAEFQRIPELVRWIFARVYQAFGGLYRGEMQAWAEGLGVSVGTATLLNCAYELSHVRRSRLLGCTAGVRWVERLGLVHIRSLDWPLPSIGPATCLFHFRRGRREFLLVGAAGHVGALSGMVPHAYSVSINWAPPAARPTFDFGPGFLLRHTFEHCDTYAEAVTALTDTPLSTSVFFTICGTEPNQACVIERTQRAAVVREMSGPVLVQTNHHMAARFRKNNAVLQEMEASEPESFFQDSQVRLDTMQQILQDMPAACAVDQAGRPLRVPPILNRDTCQRMVFCPRTGAVQVWRGDGAAGGFAQPPAAPCPID